MINALSPVDGRYAETTKFIRNTFSESGLIKYRLYVELKWFKHLVSNKSIVNNIDMDELNFFWDDILLFLTDQNVTKIKEIETTINHDVKAVEYFIKELLQESKYFSHLAEFVHFGLTSEDINNLAYGLMLNDAIKNKILLDWSDIISKLNNLANEYINVPMLSRTHGQPASPTTVGKELRNFAYRLERQYDQILDNIPVMGKLNGAVGNYNALSVAYPDINWEDENRHFVEDLGLVWNPYTTQIEPHDAMAELFMCMSRFNTILIDLCRDMWGYISIGYFKQKVVEGEVGSSTMPHKVNPINFECSEGNLGIANALFGFFSEKLPISRWQRDLSDSTVQRNIGVSFGHCVIAYESLLKGLKKIEIDADKIDRDLNDNWEVLMEAIQTIMRKYGLDGYEQMKRISRGKKINKDDILEIVNELKIPDEEKDKLRNLTPATYIGYANEL